jgi:hypothetical protein
MGLANWQTLSCLLGKEQTTPNPANHKLMAAWAAHYGPDASSTQRPDFSVNLEFLSALHL